MCCSEGWIGGSAGPGLRRRWTGAALSAVAVAAAIALPLALLSPGPATRFGPKPGAALAAERHGRDSPSGWAPVAYGDAQISVPAELACDQYAADMRSRGSRATSSSARPVHVDYIVQNPRCKQPPNMVAIELVPKGQDQTRRRSGPDQREYPSFGVQPAARGFASYLAPTLHVVMSGQGPAGQ